MNEVFSEIPLLFYLLWAMCLFSRLLPARMVNVSVGVYLTIISEFAVAAVLVDLFRRDVSPGYVVLDEILHIGLIGVTFWLIDAGWGLAISLCERAYSYVIRKRSEEKQNGLA